MDATLGMRAMRRTPLPGSFLELGSNLSLRSRACGRQDLGSESTGTDPGVFVAPGTAHVVGGPCLPLPLTSPLKPGAWMLLAATTAETIPCLGVSVLWTHPLPDVRALAPHPVPGTATETFLSCRGTFYKGR